MRIGLLGNLTELLNATMISDAKAAAQSLGVELKIEAKILSTWAAVGVQASHPFAPQHISPPLSTNRRASGPANIVGNRFCNATPIIRFKNAIALAEDRATGCDEL